MHLESKTVTFMKPQTVTKIATRIFLHKRKLPHNNYPVFLTPPPNFHPYRATNTSGYKHSTPPHSLFFKNNFQFLLFFLAAFLLVEEDEDPRNNGTEVRARGCI